MTYSRRQLLLVPVALLGAALLVRARLPRPQTEGDKWLWEQGEKVPQLSITFVRQDSDLQHKQYCPIFISSRQGIRNVLRSLEGTPAFVPDTSTLDRTPNTLWRKMVAVIRLNFNGAKRETLALPRKERLSLISGTRQSYSSHKST